MISRDNTALIVIDFQEKLLPKIRGAEAITEQAVKLIRFARELNIPILWTEQYPQGLGRTVAPITEALETELPIEKTAFGCFGAPEFAEALAVSGKKHLLLTGVEAHICVMQTGLAALQKGFKVYVPRDAVGSRHESEYEAGLHRLARAGASLVTTEMALFEILKEAGTPEFKRALPYLK
jgi:nicotinamidase-related amidase